jgi:hypothetical protein
MKKEGAVNICGANPNIRAQIGKANQELRDAWSDLQNLGEHGGLGYSAEAFKKQYSNRVAPQAPYCRNTEKNVGKLVELFEQAKKDCERLKQTVFSAVQNAQNLSDSLENANNGCRPKTYGEMSPEDRCVKYGHCGNSKD